MIFVILLVVGIIGVVGTIWISSASLRWAENPIPRGMEWYTSSPEKIEESISRSANATIRDIMKVILRFAIRHYRETAKRVTVKQEIKKRVRAFLYDYNHDVMRNPSKVWNQLKHTDTKHKQEIAPDEIISSE